MSNNKIENVGVHHIAISASDFNRSMKFYTEGLGFRQTAAWGEGDQRAALLDIGNGVCIELFANGTKEAQTNEKIVHLAFSTTDPDSAYKNALDAGAISHMEPFDVTIPSEPPLPVRIAFVKGPDGEVLEFFKECR